MGRIDRGKKSNECLNALSRRLNSWFLSLVKIYVDICCCKPPLDFELFWGSMNRPHLGNCGTDLLQGKLIYLAKVLVRRLIK